MNDVTLKELKTVVERAVRPVHTTMARKRKMREELLAHLVSIFEEEAQKLGDEQAALERASQRFGSPRELSAELQRTVPRWDRFLSVLDKPNNTLYFDPGDSLLRLAGKHLLFMGVGYPVLLMFTLLPLLLMSGRQTEIGAMFRVLLVTGIFMAALSFLTAVVPYEIGRSLYGRDSERSVRRAVLYCLASLLFLPAVAFLIYWPLSCDLAASLVQLRLGCYFAPAAPVVLVMMSRKMFEDRRYVEEWARLEVGQ